MEYIPETKLIPQYKKILLRKIRFSKKKILPDDTINVILTYCDKFLNPEDSIPIFWIRLGIETCDLQSWRFYCRDILQKSFGTSHKYSQLLSCDRRLIDSFQNHLDSWVCAYYPLSITEISNNVKYINGITIQDKKITITSIFYNNYTIKKYPVKYSYRGEDKIYKKTLTAADKKYILTFKKRLSAYLNYLENMVDKLPRNPISLSICKKLKKNIRISIKKLKKKCDKMNILNNITIKERKIVLSKSKN